MELEKLKTKILDKSITETFFVFRYEDSKFIAKQYAKEIAKLKGKSIAMIDSISECNVDDLFGGIDYSTMYILDVDKLEISSLDDYTMQSILDNGISLIIICNKIDNENSPIGTGMDTLFSLDVIVDFPKLLAWQVLDYMKVKSALNEVELKWLQDITKNDIYRIENELNKIIIFDKSKQEDIFNKINQENGYSDLNSFNIFNLTNAILKRDLKTVRDILKGVDNIDVEPMGLVTIMYNNIKNIINIQLNPNATAESLNMQPKQFNAIRYNCGKYTSSQLLNMFDFLTTIDSRLKNGKLQFTDRQFIDYIICSIM